MSLNEGKNIRARFILEVIGRPPEHLIETLEDLIKKLDSEKGVRVVETKIHEAVLLKDQKDFYTSFAEVEIEVDEIVQLALVTFAYMPAHLEIIEPELIALTNSGWNEILNELVLKLHRYDEVARILQTEKAILEKKLKDLAGKEERK